MNDVMSEFPCNDGYSYEAWHTKGPSACGKMAGIFIINPSKARVISKNFILPDGSHPLPNSIPKCGACGSVYGLNSTTLELRKRPLLTDDDISKMKLSAKEKN